MEPQRLNLVIAACVALDDTEEEDACEGADEQQTSCSAGVLTLAVRAAAHAEFKHTDEDESVYEEAGKLCAGGAGLVSCRAAVQQRKVEKFKEGARAEDEHEDMEERGVEGVAEVRR
jgi:hypothetical protein